MMAGGHPDDLTLLAYVEGELPASARGALAAHVAGCPTCAGTVHLLETSREALRSAPLLELPEARRREVLDRLPERRERLGFLEPFRHGLMRAVPALVALLLIGGIVALATQGRGGGDQEAGGDAALEAGGGETAEEAAPTEAAPNKGGGEGQTATDARMLKALGPPVARVQGPPRAVARRLREAGFQAVVRAGAVVVTGQAAAVRSALESRPRGGVEVYVR